MMRSWAAFWAVFLAGCSYPGGGEGAIYCKVDGVSAPFDGLRVSAKQAGEAEARLNVRAMALPAAFQLRFGTNRSGSTTIQVVSVADGGTPLAGGITTSSEEPMAEYTAQIRLAPCDMGGTCTPVP